MSVLQKQQVQTLLNEVADHVEKRLNDEELFVDIWIDQKKSDPSQMVSVTPKITSSDGKMTYTYWLEYFGIRPCVLRNGVVQYYLNPDDFTKKVDGNAVNLASLPLGDDVMIEIPRIGIKSESVNDLIHIRLTKKSDLPDYDYSAFSRDKWNDCDKIYVGTYKSYVTGGKMYSAINKQPTVSMTLAQYRDAAKARGAGYYDVTYAVDELIQCLYCAIVRNMDSQTAIGQGVTGVSAAINTGGSEKYGMCMENATTTDKDNQHHVKFLGIEDMWGNVWQWEDGIIKTERDSSGYSEILRAPYAAAMNSEGTGYKSVCKIYFPDYPNGDWQYNNRMNGITGAIFVGIGAGGSSSTYYCDYRGVHNQRAIAALGGRWDDGYYTTKAGCFNMHFTDGYPYGGLTTSRLIYLHLAS